MTGIIFGSTLKRAKEKLKQVIANYEKCHIYTIKSNSMIVFFTNGDNWQAVVPTGAQKGKRCNVAYIDVQLSQQIVNELIKPALNYYPFGAYDYFDVSEETYGFLDN